MSYYFDLNGKRVGPVDHKALMTYADAGLLVSTTEVFCEGDEEGVPARLIRGLRFPGDPLRLKRKTFLLIVALGVASACLSGLVYENHLSSTLSIRQERAERIRTLRHDLMLRDRAGKVAVEYIKDRLKSPATAQFSGVVAVKKTDGRYHVYGTVDAQNSYGALLRNNFYCAVMYDESAEQWSYVESELFK